MSATNNCFVLDWIDEMAAMTQPYKIVWIGGSEEQAEALRGDFKFREQRERGTT